MWQKPTSGAFNQKKKDIRKASTKRHMVFYPLCMKKGEIRKHTHYTSGYIQRIKQKMLNGDKRKEGDNIGGTLLSISFSIVLTFGTMLMFYTLRFCKLNQQGWDGGKIPLKWKWIETRESDCISNEYHSYTERETLVQVSLGSLGCMLSAMDRTERGGNSKEMLNSFWKFQVW